LEDVHLVRKTDFAEMKGVSAARVSQWIVEGKIGPDAIVATAHLIERLDPSQRFSVNGLSTRLGDEKPSPAPIKKVPAEPKATRRVVEAVDELTALAEKFADGVKIVREEDTVEFRLKANKLRQAVLQTELLEEEANARKRIYVETAAARGAATKLSAAWLSHFESAIRDFSTAAAGKFGVSGRDMQYLFQSEWKRLRGEIAARHAENAKKQPPTKEVDLDFPDDIQ
jgi:hypothetical protein